MAKKKKETSPGLFDKPKTAQELKMEGVQNLYNFLFEACNIIRGPVSQDNFKDYITPIPYYNHCRSNNQMQLCNLGLFCRCRVTGLMLIGLNP